MKRGVHFRSVPSYKISEGIPRGPFFWGGKFKVLLCLKKKFLLSIKEIVKGKGRYFRGGPP